jgi:anaerobic selenocysteine-containing dehydrogenase
MTAEATKAIRTCPFCEATCGLELTIEGGRVTRVRGDAADVFSKGFICPKGASIGELHEDPDRLRAPMLRRPGGGFDEVSWEEAFTFVDERFRAIESAHGRAAFGMYLGNPAAHSIAAVLYGRVLAKALGTRAIFTASTVDQMPKQLASALMFGTGLSVPIPDLDRTTHLLVLGADPLVSNGSLMTSPDARGRLRAIRARGGKLVVVDPRRSRTAGEADEHHFIRPGSDALLLMAIARTLFEEDLAAPGERLSPHLSGLAELRALAEPFAPELVAARTGIEAEQIRRMARELAAAAPAAAVYGRIGTTTQAFGALASWLVDVVNVLIGGLDHPGGAMFTKPATGSSNTAGEPGRGRGTSVHRWSSRVSGRGEVFGELPAVCLAEEIDAPGEGQLRALFTVAGNPVLSLPNGDRLADALDKLELMVSVDIYLNETTRHADVILPVPSVLERSHYDVALYSFAIRNVANYSPPALPLPEGALDEWQILLRLTAIATGQGPDADIEAIDAFVAGEIARRATVTAGSPVEGRDPQELLADVAPRTGPERVLDIMLRSGPYGEGFGADPAGLTLAALEAAPHGIDLGPLSPRVPELLRTQSGKIELAPELLASDVPRLRALLDSEPDRDEGLTLIGRRQLRSNNSWMHNLPKLVGGPERCTVLVSPADAERLGIEDGEPARVSGPRGSIELTARVTGDMMPGVVSVPHGWGHDLDGADLAVAREHAGANVNLLGDADTLEPLSGTAVLNGIPVTLAPALRPASV